MSITRRVFLRHSALAVVGTTAIPGFLTRAALGSIEPGKRPKLLVVIFQRGAADGLNIVVPHGERAYYAMRPSISIPREDVLDLDGFFGLHPSMASLQPIWARGIWPSCTRPDRPIPRARTSTRRITWSRARPGSKATERRMAQSRRCIPCPRPTIRSAFRAVALGPALAAHSRTVRNAPSRSTTSRNSVWADGIRTPRLRKYL